MLWELESLQPFNKPSETVKILEDVGHPNFKLMYDTGHFQACGVIGHNHVQPAETLKNQIEFIEMLPKGCIGHIHLCDTDMNTHLNMFGTKSNYGEGIIDFDELMPFSPRPTTASGGRSTRSPWERRPGRTPGAASSPSTRCSTSTSASAQAPRRHRRGRTTSGPFTKENNESSGLLRDGGSPYRGRPRARGGGGRGRRQGARVRLLRLGHRVLLRAQPARDGGREGPARAGPRDLRPGCPGRPARRAIRARRGRPWRSTPSRAATRATPAGRGSCSSARTSRCSESR